MTAARFRIVVIYLGAALASVGTVTAADPGPIRSILADQAAAWNRGDIDGFMQGYAHSPRTTFVAGDEVTRGWQTVRNRYARKYHNRAKMGTLTFSGLEITPLGKDTALVLGSWSLQRKGDQPHGKFTLLFRRLPEGWRIVLDHTS